MRRAVLAPLSLSLLLSFAPSALAAESASAALTTDQAAVAYVRAQGIFNDVADGAFHPEFRVTRVEFAAAVTGYLYPTLVADSCFSAIAPSLPPRYTKLFSDVLKTDLSARHLCAGMFTGVVSGNRDGSFRPDMAVTMAEASKMLAQGYGLTYPSLQPNTEPWYSSSMRAMRGLAAIPADASPATLVTRQAAARMFYALRSQPRFPEIRVIGTLPVPAAPAPTAGSTLTGAAAPVAVPVEATVHIDTPSVARRFSKRVSRRTLLANERKKEMEAR